MKLRAINLKNEVIGALDIPEWELISPYPNVVVIELEPDKEKTDLEKLAKKYAFRVVQCWIDEENNILGVLEWTTESGIHSSRIELFIQIPDDIEYSSIPGWIRQVPKPIITL